MPDSPFIDALVERVDREAADSRGVSVSYHTGHLTADAAIYRRHLRELGEALLPFAAQEWAAHINPTVPTEIEVLSGDLSRAARLLAETTREPNV